MNGNDKNKVVKKNDELPASKELSSSPVKKSEKEQDIKEKKKKSGCLKYIFLLLFIALIIGAGLKVFSIVDYDFSAPIVSKMILKSSSYTGTADDENAAFTMKLDYETFARFGWVKIPILPVSVAVSEVTLNDKPVYLYAGS